MLLCGNMRRIEAMLNTQIHTSLTAKCYGVEYTAMYILKRISQWLLTSLYRSSYKKNSWAFWIKNLMSSSSFMPLSDSCVNSTSWLWKMFENNFNSCWQSFRVPYIERRLLVVYQKAIFKLFWTCQWQNKNFCWVSGAFTSVLLILIWFSISFNFTVSKVY